MREHPISKSQERALRVLGLGEADTYPVAREMLATVTANTDGIPTGHTWRSAAKLSDDELVTALGARPFRDIIGSRDDQVEMFHG